MAVTPRLKMPLPQASDSMSVNPPAFATLFSNLDGGVGPTVCTSSTRPGTPYGCQWIYQTDTNEDFIWDPTASAWVKISSNPTGIIGVNSTLNLTGIAVSGTRYLISSINGLTVEQNRNYRIHVEGIFGFDFNGSIYNQPTQNCNAAIHIATSGTVNAGNVIWQFQYADAWAMVASGKAQTSFAFDTIWNSGSGNYLSTGWSFELNGSGNLGAANFYSENTLFYVERS